METANQPPMPNVSRDRLLDWLGEVGPRWGLPSEACRVHGYLYLIARPASVREISQAVGLAPDAVGRAIAWLSNSSLVQEMQPSMWRTGADPWELVIAALQERRARELGPALDILRSSKRDADADPVAARQIGRLLELVEDIAAIDAQANRLSPATLRRLLGAGSRAARFFDRALGSRRRGQE